MPAARCPSCQLEANVPAETLGRRIRCPKCSTVFQAQAPATATAEDPFGFKPTSTQELLRPGGARRGRELVDSARRWLNVSTVLIGAALFSQLLRLVLLTTTDAEAPAYLASVVAALLFLGLAGLMMKAGYNLKHRSGQVMVIIAGVVALLMGGCTLLLGGPVFLAVLWNMLQGKVRRVSGAKRAPDPVGIPVPVLIFGLIAGALGVANVTSGFKTLRAIFNPDVAKEFEQPSPNVEV